MLCTAVPAVLWEIITKQPPVRGHLREVQPSECPPEVSDLLVGNCCLHTHCELSLRQP